MADDDDVAQRLAAFKEKEPKKDAKTDLHNQVEVRIALDDYVRLVTEELYKFEPNHTSTDIRLALGYTACVIASAGALYGYYYPFEETKLLVMASVIAYFVLTGAMSVLAYFGETGHLTKGRKRDPLGLEPDINVTVTTDLPRCEVRYEITLLFTSKRWAQQPKPVKIALDINNLFDWNGRLLTDAVLVPLRAAFDGVVAPTKSAAADKKKK